MRQKSAGRTASRGPSIRNRRSLKLPAVLFGIACVVLAVAAAVAVFDRQPGAQTGADAGANFPTTASREPPPAARPEKGTGTTKKGTRTTQTGTREDDRRELKTAAVRIMNGAKIQELAATKSTLLRREGFKVKGTGSLPETRKKSVVFFKKGKARDARRVSRALRISAEEPSDRQVRAWGKGAGIVVVLGTDAADKRFR